MKNFNILSSVFLAISSLPAFLYVYLLFFKDYFIYDFIVDDDVLGFCAFFLFLAWLCKIITFRERKSIIFDFSLALIFLIFCWILAIFGLSISFDFYILSAGFYDNFAYTQTFFGWGLLTLSVIFLVFHLIYFSKFFKSLFEIYRNKAIFLSQFLWFCGALLPIFGGIFIFMASLFEIVFFKFFKKIYF